MWGACISCILPTLISLKWTDYIYIHDISANRLLYDSAFSTDLAAIDTNDIDGGLRTSHSVRQASSSKSALIDAINQEFLLALIMSFLSRFTD